MTLTETDAPLGPPWARPLHGSFEALVVESELLAGNPLGDPSRRPLYVYRAPGARPGAPVVFMLQGYSGQLDTWLARRAFEPTVVERLDAMFAAGERAAGGRRVPRRLDLARRLAVPQLGGQRPLPRLHLRRDRAVRRGRATGRRAAGRCSAAPRAATARWCCRCSVRTCSTRSGRSPATALFECSYARNFPGGRPPAAGRLRRLVRALLRRARAASTRSTGAASARRSRCTPTPARTRRIPTGRARRCCRSSSPPGGWSPRCGSGGWRRTRCGWRRATPTRSRSLRAIHLYAGLVRRVLPRSGRAGVRRRARRARRRPHARPVSRHPRLDPGPVPARGGGAGKRAGAREMLPGDERDRGESELVFAGPGGARRADPRGELSAAGAGRGLPAADRGARSPAERLPRRAGRGGARGRRGPGEGPLAGVPFAVKDDLAVAGQVRTQGSRSSAPAASADAEVGAPAARGGRDPDRDHQRARADDLPVDRLRGQRGHPQPVGSEPDARRVLRRLGRRGRGRASSRSPPVPTAADRSGSRPPPAVWWG